MKIEKAVVGYLEENCYILSFSNRVLLIDPGDEANKILDKVQNRKVEGIIITHDHFDHVGAIDDIVKSCQPKIYNFNNLKEGDNKIGEFKFECIRTPGHKEDSISIYFRDENILFSGDFLFRGTIGRWDLEGGSIPEMMNSIRKILKYPLNMTIFPGHGDPTDLRSEKDNLENYLKYF